jgi:tetratricopeptide (TPR) repeat protein
MESPAVPGRYSFSHALIQETFYERMNAPRRARTHRRVGEALEGGSAERHLTALAYHFTRAGGSEDSEKAIRYGRRAGEQATTLLAHEEAANHYARALEVLQRFHPEDEQQRLELLLELGEAHVRAGERPLAWDAFREAAALAARLGDRESLARAAIGASRRYVQQPGVVDEELIGMLERALEMTTGEHTLPRVRLLARLSGALYYSDRRARMGEAAAEASDIADRLGDPEARAYACAARRRALWEPVHMRERLQASTEMLTHARTVGDLELELQAHAWLVVDLLEQGDISAVDAQIEAFTAGAARLRQPLYLWHAAVWAAMRALLAGRLQDADTLAHEALAAGAGAEETTAPQYYAIQLLGVRLEQGRIGELESGVRQFVAGAPAVPAWRAGLARLLSATGQREEARRELDLLAAHAFKDLPMDGSWMTAVTLMGELCAELADGERAAALYKLLLPFRALNVVIGIGTLCQGSVGRYLGLLAATAGRKREAAEHFERALVANESLMAPVCLAHTQLDYARLLGPGERANELVAAAAKSADELALVAVAKRAAALA